MIFIKTIFTLSVFIAYIFPVSSLGQAVIENEYLKVQLNADGALKFQDKRQNETWGSDHVGWAYLSREGIKEKLPLSISKFTAEQYQDRLTFRFEGLVGDELEDPAFMMKGAIHLKENWFELQITEVQTKLQLEDIEYPAHLLNVKSGTEAGYIAIPHLQGIMIPSRYDVGFMRYGQNIWDLISDKEIWWDFESGNLNMPWFGAKKGNSSVIAKVNTSSDCVLHILGNHLIGEDGYPEGQSYLQNDEIRLSSLTPIWRSTKKQWGYARKLTLQLVEDGYVGMAKAYKTDAKTSGRFVTLKEKIAKNPEYEKLLGAPDLKIYSYTNRKNNPYYRSWSEPVLNGYEKVNTSFSEVIDIANDLEKMKIEKCLVLLGGWNRMGYDRELVDVWPPAEEAGGAGMLRKAAETVRSKGYLFALHDNYDDYYPDAPSYDEKYILRNFDGSMHRGGIWDGGPCYITCPSVRESLLNRNLQKITNAIPLNGYYLDVITNTSHYECYDKRHPITRKEDLNYRLQVLQNLADRGLVVGGERGTDWALPVVGFCEGLSGGGANYHRGIGYRVGLTIPLFYLVYRECVVGYWQHGTPHGREDHSNHVLLDLLNGQPSSWSVEYDQWKDLSVLFKQTYNLLGKHHQRTAHLSMVDHQILSINHMVQSSELSDGTQVWVNFGIVTYKNNDFTIPPKGFRIEYNDQQIINGRVERNIEYFD
ncbi:MAG: DUF5696 domain-containing protein [Candidatus Cyclobacteriaceae bacterium M3_2C_046]